MGALDAYYRTQPSAHDEYHALEAEARARGISARQVEAEREAAAVAYRQAEQARINALLDDPVLLRRLKDYWAPRAQGEPRPPDPLAPPPAPPAAPAARTGPSSAGRSVSPDRSGRNVYGGGTPRGGSADDNALADALFRARHHS